jgi:hypothetical protein
MMAAMLLVEDDEERRHSSRSSWQLAAASEPYAIQYRVGRWRDAHYGSTV